MYSTNYSCQILIKLSFLRQIFRNSKISNFTKIRPVGVELLRTGGRVGERTGGHAHVTKLIAAFRNFSNAPEKNLKLKNKIVPVINSSHHHHHHHHHHVARHTRGPFPSKANFHTVRSISTLFNFQYLLVSFKSSSSCLHLLPQPCATSNFPSVMCFRWQFLRKMWQLQLAFFLSIACKIVLSPWYYAILLRSPHHLLHPSPAPHFETFQVYVVYFSKCPVFSIIQNNAPKVAVYYSIHLIQVQFAGKESVILAKNGFCHGNPEFNFTYTTLHSVENSLWKRLWTCRKTDNRMNEWILHTLLSQ